MLPKKKIEGLVEYWIKSSEKDLDVMEGLYGLKRYSSCLFFAHLVLEKALKATVVRVTDEYAPRTHNLPHLAELAKLELSQEEKELLEEADTFNMEARYPDEKFDFYKKCTKAYTDRIYKPIVTLYKKLCQKAM